MNPKPKTQWIYPLIFFATAQAFRFIFLCGLTISAFFALNTWLSLGVDPSALIAGMVGIYYWFSSKLSAPAKSKEEQSEGLYLKMTLLCHETGPHGVIHRDGYRWPITESLFLALISEKTGVRFYPWVYRVFEASQPWRKNN